MNTNEQSMSIYAPSLDTYIDGWLQSVYASQSRSERTVSLYREMIQNFRSVLQSYGIDLNSQDHDKIAQMAEKWANSRSVNSQRKNKPVAQSTFNLRLAALSSFYLHVQEQLKLQRITFDNPIDRIKRPKIQAYASAEPLSKDFVVSALAGIDRRASAGKRDYAILAIGLRTGRRAHELINLRAKHLSFNGNRVRILFDHCKGGKVMKDTLDTDLTAVLLEYLFAVYGPELEGFIDDAPVWISFSRQNHGKAMSIHALYDICERYLQTTKIHTLRHTFARESEEEGAKPSDIQHRLGHENLNQTGVYLQAIRSDENPIGERLTRRFGIKPLGE